MFIVQLSFKNKKAGGAQKNVKANKISAKVDGKL